jgi:hypothetical protein
MSVLLICVCFWQLFQMNVTTRVVHKICVTICVLCFQALWVEAKQYPLYSLLNKKVDYVFVCINEMAVKVCCYFSKLFFSLIMLLKLEKNFY